MSTISNIRRKMQPFANQEAKARINQRTEVPEFMQANARRVARNKLRAKARKAGATAAARKANKSSKKSSK
jgi:hypothetical protein